MQYWYEAFPHLELDSHPGHVCPHLTDEGCELDRNKRPKACVEHLCEEGEQAYWTRRKSDMSKTPRKLTHRNMGAFFKQVQPGDLCEYCQTFLWDEVQGIAQRHGVTIYYIDADDEPEAWRQTGCHGFRIVSRQ